MVNFWEIIEDKGDGTLSHWFFKEKNKTKNKVIKIIEKALKKERISISEIANNHYSTIKSHSVLSDFVEEAWNNEDGLIFIDGVVECYPCTFDD